MTKAWQRSEQRQVQRFYGGSDEKYAAVRPRPDLPPGTDLRPEIAHIVILMMENHSYDNYFGLLGRGNGFPLGPDGQPTASNVQADGTPVPAFHFDDTGQHPQAPTQSWNASHLQYNNGANDGFVKSVELTVPGADATLPMGYWTAADLPFYHSLGSCFPVADRWFCSCLGPTFPNRRFLLAGTAHGLIDDLPFGMVDYPEAGTILDVLTRNNISWINYHAVSKTKALAKRLLGKGGLKAFRRLALGLGKVFPAILKWGQGNLQFTADLYPLGLAGAYGHLKSLDQFFRDADEGTLPAVSIVDPAFSDYSEENAQDVALGEGFAAEVINRVMHGKGWTSTLLIWLYDEHGGYYDHEAPPSAPAPDGVVGQSLLNLPGWVKTLLKPFVRKYLQQLEAIDTGDPAYDRYGFRVPAVIVSPYAKAGFVDSSEYDHTSILKLIEDKWNLPSLTARDAAAVAPWEALDLTSTPFLTPPVLAPPAKPWSLSAG